MDGLRADVDTSELNRLLARIDRELPGIGADTGLDTARDVATRARQNLPHRTGRLAGSVAVFPMSDGAEVRVGAPYAGWIEYGGSRGRRFVPEGRYVGPAAEGAEHEWATRAERELERRF